LRPWLRALAMTGAMRSLVMPDIPTMAEFVRGYDVSSWFGIGAPGRTPPEIIERLGREINAGFDMVHVPYRGGAPAITDLLGGQVSAPMMFGSMAASIKYIMSGKLRPLAVTTSTRLKVLPDIPTVGESVPGYEATGFFGIGAPKNTPAAMIEKLNTALNAGLADPKIKARLADLDGTELPGSPEDFGKLIAAETEKWAKVVTFSGATPQ
jgi:tripartite-type tricarboxylate transporter receptor subunit TctC